MANLYKQIFHDLPGDSMEYVKVPKDVWKPIEDLVHIGLYKNEKEALIDLIREQAEKKIDFYKQKIREMEEKYGIPFVEFEDKIKKRKEKENFEEWDDYVLWEGFEKSLGYWMQVLDGFA
jgi:Arc/MetJ-type ribon-helix-helix transcriptional regulator